MIHQVVAVNCLELLGMPSLADRSIDVVIADPPYSKKVHECSRRGMTDYKERKGAGARDRRRRDLGFDHLTPEVRRGTAEQVARLVRRWALIFTDLEGVGSPQSDEYPEGSGWIGDIQRAGLEYVRTGVWHKLGSTPQTTGDRPGSSIECIVIAHQMRSRPRSAPVPVRKRWNGGGHHAFWEHPIVLDRAGTGERYHTTQKPLSLMEELVLLFSNEGETILDPFCGSGTTGIAARMHGRGFLGMELNPEWAETARRRVAGERVVINEAQPELF